MKAISQLGLTLVLLCVMCSFQKAAAQLAPGVQQSAAQTATVTGTVTQSGGAPIAGADVHLIGSTRLATKSDARGNFVFTGVSYGIYRIDVTAAALGTASRGDIMVKGDITVAIQFTAQTAGGLKTIAQVSTRSAGAQINVTPASIASINPSDYAFQGNTSWKELLDHIPGVSTGGWVFGGNSAVNAIPDGPLNPVVLSINGAQPYETSVTLDGMPLVDDSYNSTPGGGADLGLLPMPTFDAADVVRGPGANAPSIVDSIGGSFVLHPPGRVDKDQFEFSASNDPYGGIVINTMMALHLGRLSATIVYDMNNSPGPLGNQNVIPAFSATPLTVNGQPFLSGGFIGTISNPVYQSCSVSNASGCGYQDSLLYCCVPISTAWSQHDGSVALSYDVTPAITAQLFYAGSTTQTTASGLEVPVDFTPGPSYTGSLTPGMYSYIQGLEPQDIAEASSLWEEKITAYWGRGIVRLAALQNNTFIQSSFPYCLPDGQYTVYGTGYYAPSPGTPVTFNGTSEFLTFFPLAFDDHSWVNSRDLLASYATQIGSNANIGISDVGSYYNDPYWYNLTLGGTFTIPFNQSNAISEHTNEVRIFANTNVFNTFDFSASWYFSKGTYHVPNPADPTGNTWADSVFSYSAPRLGAVWHASRDIVLRAAAGGGYALPQLSDLLGFNEPTPFCTTVCTIGLTNLNLTPETSFGFDVGADIRSHRNTVLSFDLYRTNLYGQFYASQTLTGTYTGLPLYTIEDKNLAQSRFEGINVDIRHDVSQGIYWHGALGLTRGYVVSVPAGFYNTATCTNCTNTYVIPGINFNGTFESTVPYANGAAQVGYRWSPEKYVDLSPTYYGNGNPYFEPAFIEIDAHAGYPLTKNIALVTTFRNITGIHGQNYQYLFPSMGAPTIAGQLYPLYALPYGPRTVIVTTRLKL